MPHIIDKETGLCTICQRREISAVKEGQKYKRKIYDVRKLVKNNLTPRTDANGKRIFGRDYLTEEFDIPKSEIKQSPTKPDYYLSDTLPKANKGRKISHELDHEIIRNDHFPAHASLDDLRPTSKRTWRDTLRKVNLLNLSLSSREDEDISLNEPKPLNSMPLEEKSEDTDTPKSLVRELKDYLNTNPPPAASPSISLPHTDRDTIAATPKTYVVSPKPTIQPIRAIKAIPVIHTLKPAPKPITKDSETQTKDVVSQSSQTVETVQPMYVNNDRYNDDNQDDNQDDNSSNHDNYDGEHNYINNSYYDNNPNENEQDIIVREKKPRNYIRVKRITGENLKPTFSRENMIPSVPSPVPVFQKIPARILYEVNVINEPIILVESEIPEKNRKKPKNTIVYIQQIKRPSIKIPSEKLQNSNIDKKIDSPRKSRKKRSIFQKIRKNPVRKSPSPSPSSSSSESLSSSDENTRAPPRPRVFIPPQQHFQPQLEPQIQQFVAPESLLPPPYTLLPNQPEIIEYQQQYIRQPFEPKLQQVPPPYSQTPVQTVQPLKNEIQYEPKLPQKPQTVLQFVPDERLLGPDPQPKTKRRKQKPKTKSVKTLDFVYTYYDEDLDIHATQCCACCIGSYRKDTKECACCETLIGCPVYCWVFFMLPAFLLLVIGVLLAALYTAKLI